MKPLLNIRERASVLGLSDICVDDDIAQVMSDFGVLESNIVYFSAGSGKIKEVLLKRDASYSV